MEWTNHLYKSNTWSHDFRRTLLRPWSFQLHSEDFWQSDDATLKDEFEFEDVQKTVSTSRWRRPLLSRSLNKPEPTSTPPGWWQDQMLFDRSIRSMAALTALYAFIMSIVCAVKLKPLINRTNVGSTSVSMGDQKVCGDLKGAEIFIQLLVNFAATTILGMSNTYQQLVTSLNITELRASLNKFGDCRVGTNSPTTINRKQSGRATAWLAWLLLICTSLPIHFFANSIVGPSVYRTPPKHVTFSPRGPVVGPDASQNDHMGSEEGALCWILFRTGHFSGWELLLDFGNDVSSGFSYTNVNVSYTSAACDAYAHITDFDSMKNELDWSYGQPGATQTTATGNCSLMTDVACDYSDEAETTCRLTIRMSAALILAGCLVVKACYMIAVNVRGQDRKKTQCLTFGDVIIACVMDRSLSIKNECMVNAGEAYRRSTRHVCHKHCTSKQPTECGDELGHCQKCKKFNQFDRAVDLPQPTIATKYKKSLLTNLGSAALIQMILLSLSTFAMVGGSVALVVFVAMAMQSFNEYCSTPPDQRGNDDKDYQCPLGLKHFLSQTFGGFGGFDSTASIGNLPPNRASSEIMAFAISNGAQLLYSLLYLLLIYNFTLISMEYDWGNMERQRMKLRTTLVRGPGFRQSYLLQLPKRVIYPMMVFSALMHWLLGQAISTTEIIWAYHPPHSEHAKPWESSTYSVVYGAYSIWVATIFMVLMTSVCWWAFTYTREGFIPQMYGSIRVCCAATTRLIHNADKGIKWGDLGVNGKFRHAGFSVDEVGEIVPAELYAEMSEDRKVK